MTTHTPQKVPEHFSRVDIGAYMRELRLHYALSEQDVSERLHIRTRYITAIEAAQFDAMPGKAYARGYVHTYAEFLGLDADQVVERCFGGEMAREVQAHSIPESASWYKRNRRYGGVLAVLVLLGGLFYFATHSNDASDVETAELREGVESVPEEYLASMRNQLMPVASNYDCLGDATALGCYFSQRLTRQWVRNAERPNMAPAPADAYADAPVDDIVEDVAEKAPAKKEVPAKKPAPAAKKPAADRTTVYRAPRPPAAAPFGTGPSEPAPKTAPVADEPKKPEETPKQEAPKQEAPKPEPNAEGDE